MIDAVYPVSRETKKRLSELVAQVRIWQSTTNLVASSTLDDIWNRHVADSLQCIALKPESRVWLDLGSGGGFPGLVIAACLAEYPDRTITLIESNQKKAAFLRRAAREIGANVTVINDRIENIHNQLIMPDIVTARALAALPQLFTLSASWLEKGSIGLFHKGSGFKEELANCDSEWSYDLLCHQSRIISNSVILEISNLQSRNA